MAYFAVCIFLSAFLLFQIQPMIARYILPWFGGTPAVWSTVMLFFQVLLTGGYAYSNWLIGSHKRREVIHIVLLGAASILMLVFALIWKSPITPDASWKPQGNISPVWEIFKLLAISVGLPYFLLSSNSPLIQAWFHRAYPERTAYRLYALSNIGSLLALVTYPVLIEPYLTLTWQGRIWSLGFIVFAGLAIFGAIKSLRMKPPASAGQENALNDSRNPAQHQKPTARDYILWILLAATASILLLATTSHITQEVAVIPFLWIIPLTIYLLSFVLAFSGERWYSRQFFLVLFFIATILYAWAMKLSGSLNVSLGIGIFSLVLFTASMVCHGELYRLRPHPSHLTAFYLMVSVGGALGGILVNFVAPYIFKGYWELPLGMALCWLLFVIVTIGKPLSYRSRILFITNTVLIYSALAITVVQSYQSIKAETGNYIGAWRNFYGVVRVQEYGADGWSTHSYGLVHGITIHGKQYLAPEKRSLPNIYYSPKSGAGLAFLNYPHSAEGIRVGVLGLGIGTLSTYAKPGDVYRFYEINPVVIQLAEGEGGYFSYLRDSAAKIDIIPGDARLSLERELSDGAQQNYDILVLDVFSSDAIPVHLLDREAFEIYLQQLKPDGLLVLHITNRYLDLIPVVWTLADHFELSRVVIDDPGDYDLYSRSIWMLLSRNSYLLAIPEIQSRAKPMNDYVSPVQLWTDDYSNLFQILK
jgi:SAM-dependent methyltransferase